MLLLRTLLLNMASAIRAIFNAFSSACRAARRPSSARILKRCGALRFFDPLEGARVLCSRRTEPRQIRKEAAIRCIPCVTQFGLGSFERVVARILEPDVLSGSRSQIPAA